MTQRKASVENYIESRLEEWGDFYRYDHHGLGYPSMDTLGRVQRDGGILEKGQGHRREPDNANAEEIGDLIRQMGQSSDSVLRKGAKAINMKYIKYPDLINDNIARKMNVSIRMFQLYLSKSKNWLAEKLGAKRILNGPEYKSAA